MKASQAYKKDEFNSMNWKWVTSSEVVITLLDNKQGKSGKFKARVVDGKVTKILEDEVMK